ncbi:protein SHORT ROOT IN SALT MEDIUM 1 isoform X1 [Carya illinoinensis]|uniref:protein SHORT ROOT IN SALT MEDIUM 1 isoform X1 n=1 Tax=Carya illinoinensis TaxID=32201 RepID=UPI001C720BB2|nr:protein SHORT ROOT IN SALT MEDIUM 1 isoform X1 [Carya illinoinensis]XP_042983457.1 protein SHORT ROOT IN SALT MEDIUM 1 isoform X1 [Carya illinoinensis]
MYSSRGSNAYGQQSYAGQSAYGANLGPAYSASSLGGPDGGSQAARHSSMLGGSLEADVGGYRTHPPAAAHYGGQYSSVYGLAALSSAQQVPALNAKGAGPSALEGRGSYASAIPGSPKYVSSDYVQSSGHGYGHKGDQLYADKIPDYPGPDRHQYGERHSAYIGKDLQSEQTRRYADSIGFSNQNQNDMYDRIDKALLRQEQLLKSQSLQSASLDGSARQADYLAARVTTSRHPTQDAISYGGRMDADPRTLSMLSASSYSGQRAPSIVGEASLRNMDDLVYAQSSSNPGYGVSLPPGRDYATGKGLHGASAEVDYPSSTLSRSRHIRIEDHKDDKACYLREFELREEERRRERLRVRERDRQRERELDRERERGQERVRERQRIMERWEEEGERGRKRGLETRRDRIPPRKSRDRHDSSVAKEAKSLRQDSRHHDTLHRHHSPVKEKRREYICKVYSSSLVDVERDFLSIDKRYPRLFVSAEFSKAVVNWPKENLKLPIHTPVSFEHDVLEEERAKGLKVPSAELLVEEPAKSGSTVWNAKMILMSGLSKNAMEELSSEKSSDDRIPHICNIVRFGVLRRDQSWMAIGGPWDSVDGGDPSVDDTSLIRTVLRYAKNITQLDLQHCCNWNRFLEIHYDRVGKDGLFSHKEVTVLFVPDLSECLPSLEAWRDQWLAHKKDVAGREQQVALKKEWSREKKDGLKDKQKDSTKDVKRVDKSGKEKESAPLGQSEDVNKKEKDVNDVKAITAEEKADGNDKRLEKKGGAEQGEENKTLEKNERGKSVGAQKSGSVKSGKKKIIKKIVRQKVVDKTAGNSASNQNDKLDEKENGKNTNSEIPDLQDADSGAKHFVRKKVMRKIPVGKTARNKDMQDKQNDNLDPSSAAVVEGTIVKKTVKRKIIKRVAKRKVSVLQSGDAVADNKKDAGGDEIKVVRTVDEPESMEGQAANTENQVSEIKRSGKKTVEQNDDVVDSSKTEIKANKDAKSEGEKSGQGAKLETQADEPKASQNANHSGKGGKSKDGEKSKDGQEKKDNNGKYLSRSRSNKELIDKRKPEEPPRHPGLILQTKWSTDSKLRSVSLSLDSLLDYTDKDIDEASFELSLFAESLYEMLQYQMGCRLLTFLEKLRVKFVRKRNQRKRQQNEVHEMERDKNSPAKRLKTNEHSVKDLSIKPEISSPADIDDDKTKAEEDKSVDPLYELKMEDETDGDEDPEEDPEEYEETEESMQRDSYDANKKEEGKTNVNAEPEKVLGIEKDEAEKSLKVKPKAVETNPKSDEEMCIKREATVDSGERGETSAFKEVSVDKELLQQAFRFFDRNRVGYIRVEDMRLIIHNLGKFLSHRDVKELVQSALLESNTARDDRILYNKLVRMSGI